MASCLAEWQKVMSMLSSASRLLSANLLVIVVFSLRLCAAPTGLTLTRENNWLLINGPVIPGGAIRINYLEAYCRANSTDADWVQHTVIKHTTELVSLGPDGKVLKLHD